MTCPDCASLDVASIQGTRKMVCRHCRLTWWVPPVTNEAMVKAQYDAYLRIAIEKADGATPLRPLPVTPTPPLRPVFDDKGKLIV